MAGYREEFTTVCGPGWGTALLTLVRYTVSVPHSLEELNRRVAQPFIPYALQRSSFRFAYQQMNMLWHDDVSGDVESIPAA